MKTTLFLILVSIISCKATRNNTMIDKEKIQNERAFFDGLGKIYPMENSVSVRNEKIKGINCYWFSSFENTEEVIIYLHGGSYYMGSISSHKAMLSHFAKKLGRKQTNHHDGRKCRCMAGNFGFDTIVVPDATATFNKKGINGQHFSAELIHETALASLNGEFATVVTTAFLQQNIY